MRFECGRNQQRRPRRSRRRHDPGLPAAPGASRETAEVFVKHLALVGAGAERAPRSLGTQRRQRPRVRADLRYWLVERYEAPAVQQY
jgi:hypothetical protein